jgi:hypothetical protein
MGIVAFVGPFDGNPVGIGAEFGLERVVCLRFLSPFSRRRLFASPLVDDTAIQLDGGSSSVFHGDRWPVPSRRLLKQKREFIAAGATPNLTQR